jgi:hypothetical protein
MEVVGEDERNPELCCDTGAPVGRPEHPELGNGVLARHGADAGVARAQVAAQLRELIDEAVGRGGAQRHRRAHVGTGGATEAEIYAVRMQRLEHREALRHRQRRVVGQHHAARADADALRVGGEMGDQHLGGS